MGIFFLFKKWRDRWYGLIKKNNLLFNSTTYNKTFRTTRKSVKIIKWFEKYIKERLEIVTIYLFETISVINRSININTSTWSSRLIQQNLISS